MMTRALNKLDTELALTQAAAMLLGMPAGGSSESFVYVDSWAFLQAAKGIAPSDRACDANADASNNSAIDMEDALDDAVGCAQEIVMMGVRHGDEEIAQPTASAPVYNLNGQALPVEWVEHYRHRGKALRGMSPIVYCLTIQIVRAIDVITQMRHRCSRICVCACT